MRKIHKSIQIERSPEEVFAFATDPANTPRWLKGVTQLEVRGGGPVKLGSVLHETRRMKGREISADIEVTEHGGPAEGFDPPYVHAASSQAAGVLCTYRYFFHKEKGHTRVDLTIQVEPRSLFGRLAAGAMLSVMQRTDGMQLDHLKEAVESGPPA